MNCFSVFPLFAGIAAGTLLVSGSVNAAGLAAAAEGSAATADLTVRVEATAGVLHFVYEPASAAQPATDAEACHPAETLIVPLGKTTRILTTSTDVPYTWNIALLGLSIDAVPGLVTETVIPARDKSGIGKGRLVDKATGVETVASVRVRDANDASGKLNPQIFCSD